MAEGEDWLFPEKEEQQAKLEEKGLVFAQKYLVFHGPTADPRARELFEHWTNWVRRQKVPSDNHGALAAHGALREFLESIAGQIEFAMKGAQSLPPKTRNDNA